MLDARPGMVAAFRADRRGFVSARLVRLDEKMWLDFVEWTDDAAWDESKVKGANLPAIGAFFAPSARSSAPSAARATTTPKTTLADRGFGGLKPRHGAVLAYLDPDGVRATDLSRLSGQYKQNIGTLIDELESLGYVERRPDPSDRRAKLICPTERGLAPMKAADAIMADIQQRHARRVGPADYGRFKRMLIDITVHQRDHIGSAGED